MALDFFDDVDDLLLLRIEGIFGDDQVRQHQDVAHRDGAADQVVAQVEDLAGDERGAG